VSLDGVYDCRRNGRRFSTAHGAKHLSESQRPKIGETRPQAFFDAAIFDERFNTIERVFGWEDKSVACWSGSSVSASCITR